jgi:hypothetical protein
MDPGCVGPKIYAERYQLSREQIEPRTMPPIPQELFADWQVRKAKLLSNFDSIGQLSRTGSRRTTGAMDIISSSLAMEVSSSISGPISVEIMSLPREEEPLESSTATMTATAPTSSTLSAAALVFDPTAKALRISTLFATRPIYDPWADLMPGSSTASTTATAPASSTLSEATPVCDPWDHMVRGNLGPERNEQVVGIVPPTTASTPMPGSVLPAPAPWPKAEPTQSVSVVSPTRIQLDAQVQLGVDAEHRNMAAADVQTQDYLRDEESTLAKAGVASEGFQQIRDERRVGGIE